MAIQWNNNQKNAIDGRGGTMLVSAAAGSGKTAVLVERVIQRLLDKENPCSINELLIVTFTKAAASQMKDKISEALAKKASEEPDNKAIKKNRFLMPYANIGTIDSFCIELVRNHFQFLNISPDFTIADDNSEKLFENAAVMSVITRFHDEKPEEFVRLNTLINDNKDDSNISSLIIELYKLASAYPFPDSKLESFYENYLYEGSFANSTFGKYLIEQAEKYTDSCLEKIDICLKRIPYSSEKIKEKFWNVFENDRQLFLNFKSVLSKGVWDDICEFYRTASFERATISKCTDVDYGLFHGTRGYSRKTDKNSFSKQLYYFNIGEEETEEAGKNLRDAVRTLIDAVHAFSAELRAIKDEENSYSFNDVLHFALTLLVEDKDGAPVITDTALDLSKNYKEILVDEYQDVSKAQDMIFYALSGGNKNRFMVGDVKQSIYAFRQAMPEVFTDLRKSMTDYNGKDYPAREYLNCNYRSRKGITDTVNFIFSQIMRENTGGVDYGEGERLVPEAKYPETDEPCTEICLVSSDEKKDSLTVQAEFAANRILNAVENKMQITGSDGKLRDAGFSDFCILFRSGKKAVTPFTKVFEKFNIPFVSDNKSSFLQSPEIGFVISLLRIINNPTDDVSMLSVLLSPVYGFTPDELATMRTENSRGNIYSCVVTASESGNEKAAAFLKSLAALRRISLTYSAGEFTAKIIDETGYRAIVSSMKNGEIRRANLNSFINLANNYEQNGVKGISGFVRFLDKTEGQDIKANTNNKTDSSNAVKMMTIHGSKGLEFPVVILVNNEKAYNDQDLKKAVIPTKNCGLGMKYIEDGVRYDTLFHCAAVEEKKKELYAEEMRILYVALTRAKEKMIIVSSETNFNSWKVNIIKGTDPDEQTIFSLNSHAKLILTAMMKHPDAHLLREKAGIETDVHEPCESAVTFETYTPSDEETSAAEKEEQKFEVNDEMLNEIKERISFVYPYESLNGITAKQIASKLESNEFDRTFFASSIPSFASKKGMTPAQRGIAMHRFMQYADFGAAKSNIQSELERLVNDGMLTQEEAKSIDIAEAEKFFLSDTANRILNADKVYKEYSFTSLVPLEEFSADIDAQQAAGESIVIEGVVDCAYEKDGRLTVVDFKTDRAKTPGELVSHYSGQLNIYKKCLAKVLGKDSADAFIYSFALGREIEIP